MLFLGCHVCNVCLAQRVSLPRVHGEQTRFALLTRTCFWQNVLSNTAQEWRYSEEENREMREPIHSRRPKAALVRTSISLFILLLSVSAICCGPKAPEKASLTVEVGVDYSLGGIQPVA